MILRDYQHAAIQALYTYFGQKDGNPLLCLPTGSGKSVIQAEFQRQVMTAWPNQRILLLTHVKELVEQNAAKLLELWPEAPLGIYSASLRRRESFMPLVMASIQSVYNKADLLGAFNLCLIDECHLVPKKSNTMYRRLLDDLRKINPLMKIIGMSATPYRLDSGYLHKGDNAIFTDIAYELPIRFLIDNGYLSPVITKGGIKKIDTSSIRTRAGEYLAEDVDKAVHADGLTESAVAEIRQYGKDRRSWIVFCSSVAHAQEVAALIGEHVPAACLHGATPKDEREQIIGDMRSGALRCLVNVEVATTGFDCPSIDLIAFLRPTQSPGLYIQMTGRGMRLSPGKDNCLVLDFAGNVERHGPVDAVDVAERRARALEDGERGRDPLGKECPQCGAVVSIFRTECDCGHKWPVAQKFEATATAEAILSSQIKPVWYEVDEAYYRRHRKTGKPDSMRVDYVCGLNVFSEWICIQHEGYAREKAAKWLSKRGQDDIYTVSEAINASHYYPKPSRIRVKKSGKHDEIVDHEFARKPDRQGPARQPLNDDGDSTILFDVPVVRHG